MKEYYYKISHIFILFIAITSIASAQQYNFKKFDIKDGLATSQVYSLKILENGSLAIGTYGAGLNVYDGHEFIFYNENAGLTNNNIRGIELLNNGEMWMASSKGISVFDGHSFNNYNKKNGLLDSYIWKIFEDSKNNIWIGSNSGLQIYKNNKFNAVNDTLLNNNAITSFCEDSDGNLYIGTESGLLLFDGKKFSKPDLFKKFDNYQIYALLYDSNKNVWVGSNTGAFKLNSGTITKFSQNSDLSRNFIYTIFEDHSGKIWFGTDVGAMFIENNQLYRRTAAEGFTDYKVWAFENDLENNLWFGTDEGLFLLSNDVFKIYKEFNGKPIDSWDMIKDKNGEYWLGTEVLGILKFKDGNFSKFNTEEFLINGYMQIFEDNKNRIWFGSDDGIFKYESANRKKFTFEYNTKTDPITSIFQLSSDTLLFATLRNGLLVYDESKFTQINNEKGLNSSILYSIVRDSKDNIWIGTGEGLYLMDKDTFYIPRGFEWLDKYSILQIVEDKYENLWLGTYERGLYSFNLKNIHNPTFDSISVNDGLSDYTIIGSQFDGAGNLWVGTNLGLSRIDIDKFFNKDSNYIISYNNNDGFPGNEGLQSSFFFENDHSMWWGTIDGLLEFDPTKVELNTYQPFVKIKNVKVMDKDFQGFTISNSSLETYTDKFIELEYYQNNITINYVGISLTNPTKIKYSYKINNQNWSIPTLSNSANITNLDPGKHTFFVKATNNDGVWSDNFAQIQFFITTPFWKTIWFYILAIIIFLTLVYVVYLKRMKKIKRINEELKERIKEKNKYELELMNAKEKAERSDKLKSEFLAQMSHEIRTPINSIVSFAYLLKEELEDKIDESLKDSFSIIENGSRRLIRTIDSILNMSQIQTGNVELNHANINLCKILKEIIQEFINLAENKNLHLELKVGEEPCNIYADLYTTTQLFANLIDNAIKYTNKGSVIIEYFRNYTGKVHVKISDTGIGISEEFQKNIFNPFTQEEQGYSRKFEGTGLGLSLVKKYCEMNNAEIILESKKQVGSIFTIIFNGSSDTLER